MSAALRVNSARNDVLKFLAREQRQVGHHIQRFGPLAASAPTPGSSAEGAEQAAAPAPAAIPEGELQLPNPFIPRLNPKTQRWADPKYSLRRQAELVKKAKLAGLLHMLPPGPKVPLLDPSSEVVQKFNPKFAAAAADAFAKQAAAQNKKPWHPVLPPVRANESWSSNTEGMKPIHWEGKVELKAKAGADIGIKLYAGKKRMFKLHKFERDAPKLAEKRELALKTMDRRIAAYKDYYKKRRPNPLKPAKASTKSPKLPF